MKIAVLGWGSLIWDPRQLSIQAEWQTDGPVLPLEFSRVSSDGRLTLVIDPLKGTKLQTRYALSAMLTIDEAAENLRKREHTTSKYIGRFDVRRDKPADETQETIRKWAETKGIDAVTWTALRPNFEDERGKEFSVPQAITYLESRSDSEARRAWEYIARAPPEVQTELRKELAKPH